MEPEKFTFTIEKKVVDSQDVPIRVGSVLRHEDGTVGVVIQIVHEGDLVFWPAVQIGDLIVSTSPGCERVSNRYESWTHVPHAEQSYTQRLLSWKYTPFEQYDENISKDEALAIDGITAILPRDIVDWENGPWPDRFEDALTLLVRYLEQEKRKEDDNRSADGN